MAVRVSTNAPLSFPVSGNIHISVKAAGDGSENGPPCGIKRSFPVKMSANHLILLQKSLMNVENRESVLAPAITGVGAMMGRSSGDRDRLFDEFNLDEVVPTDHLVRRIDGVPDPSWLHGELARRLGERGRHRFFPTAPPFHVPGAVGAPANLTATV